MSEPEAKTDHPIYIGISSVADRYGVCTKTITRWVRASLFPQPVRLSRRCLRWNVSDLEAFEQRIEESDHDY